MTNALYMIEGDPALSAVRAFIADRQRVVREINALASSFGASQYWFDRESGVLRSLAFEGDPHPDFKKPDRHGRCFPKRNSAASATFRAQRGHASAVQLVADLFSVPLSLQYTTEGGWGSTHIGNFLAEAGFLYFGPEGPYALWIPDVAAEVARMQSEGKTVTTATFDMELPGCRRIESEEWDILVARHRLEAKRATRR